MRAQFYITHNRGNETTSDGVFDNVYTHIAQLKPRVLTTHADAVSHAV